MISVSLRIKLNENIIHINNNYSYIHNNFLSGYFPHEKAIQSRNI